MLHLTCTCTVLHLSLCTAVLMTSKTFCEQKNYGIQNPKFLDTGNYAPIIGHPLGGGGGDPGQIQFCMGTYMGICTIILPTRRGKSGSFCLLMPYTTGKTGEFVKKLSHFPVVLNEGKRPRCEKFASSSSSCSFQDGGSNDLRKCYANPSASC